MSIFEKVLERSLINEGFYSNHPNDKGGETCCGISRKFFPLWKGWDIIDNIKKTGRIPNKNDFPVLKDHIFSFYMDNFWNKLMCDKIMSVSIAEKLFDMSINIGIKQAVMFLQRGLNLLNRDGRAWPVLTVDGIMGVSTLSCLNLCVKDKSDESCLLDILRVQQGSYYINLVLGSPEQKVFIRGWIKRSMI